MIAIVSGDGRENSDALQAPVVTRLCLAGLRFKTDVDGWLAANKQYSGTSTVPTVQCDPDLAIEVLPDPAPARAPAPKTPSQNAAASTSAPFPSEPNAHAPTAPVQRNKP